MAIVSKSIYLNANSEVKRCSNVFEEYGFKCNFLSTQVEAGGNLGATYHDPLARPLSWPPGV